MRSISVARASRCIIAAALIASGTTGAFADPLAAPVAAQVRASRFTHHTVESYAFLGRLSATLNVRDAGLIVAYAGKPACTMWFGNLAAIRVDGKPRQAGVRYFPNLDLSWKVGRDSLIPDVVPPAADASSHCSTDSSFDAGRAHDYYVFEDAKTRDDAYQTIVTAFLAWHHRFPEACALSTAREKRKPVTGIALCGPDPLEPAP